MKMKSLIPFTLACAMAVHASPRSSTSGDYTIQANTWTSLTGGIVSDDGTQCTVTDTAATEGRKFYRVQVNKP